MNMRVEEKLNEESLNIYHEKFNNLNDCNWTLQQLKQSLANQDYLKHLVFYKNNQIVGITEYSVNNPWNKILFNIIYAKDGQTQKYIKDYTQRIMKRK